MRRLFASLALAALLCVGLSFSPPPPDTTWYINQLADPGGDGTTQELTGAHCTFQTIVAGQAAVTGDQHGNSLLIARGTPAPVYREQYTVPAWGTAAGQFTFGAYGTGDDPIINGANVVSGWSVYGISTWTADDQTGKTATDHTTTAIHFRNMVDADHISISGTRVRALLKAHSTLNSVIQGVGIGIRSGSTEDYTATGTALLFSGVQSKTITAGTTAYTDWTTFTLDETLNHLLHIWVDASYKGSAWQNAAFNNSYYAFTGGDVTLTADWTGTVWSGLQTLRQIEVDNNVWSAALTSEPEDVFFDGIKGQEKGSAALCVAARDWFWASNVLYCYSTTDPDTAYTTIEASVRDQNIIASQSYITIENLSLKYVHINNVGIYGGDHVIVQDCTMQYAYTGANVGLSAASGVGNIIRRNTMSYAEWSAVNSTGNVSTVGDPTYIQNNTITYSGHYGISIRAQYWIVENNDVSMCGGNTIAGNGIETVIGVGDPAGIGHNNIIRYNKVHDNVHGVAGAGDTPGDGIFMHTDTQDNEVYYNICYGNDGSGINNFNAFSNSIYNNVCYGNNQGDIVRGEITLAGTADTATDLLVKNNIGYATATGAYAIYVDSYTYDNTLTITNNCWYRASGNWYFWNASGGATLAIWNALTGVGTDLNSDPFMTNPASQVFTLQSTSPCINAGTDVGLTTDYAGNPIGDIIRAIVFQPIRLTVRPIRNMSDIGAYEYKDH